MSSGKPLVDVSVIIYNYVCVAQPQEPCMKSSQFAPPEETHPSIWFSASEWLMQVPLQWQRICIYGGGRLRPGCFEPAS